MKRPFRSSAVALTALSLSLTAFTSCDDDTAGIGAAVMPEQDIVSAAQQTFAVTTRTIASDSVLANTNGSFLGCVIDPETRAKTTCNFLAQFNVLENTTFPERSLMLQDDAGQLLIDSCRIRVFIDSYYGDSLTTMKLTMQELDTNKVINENTSYYTNLDATAFLTEGKGQKASISYAVRDLSRPDSAVSSASYRSIVVPLPVSYAREMVDKYYQRPDYFQNAYKFIHHVCPGFYFRTAGGVGSMVSALTSTLDIYFRYHSTTTAGNDTILSGMQRMAATEEVIQQTIVDNKLPDAMTDANADYTYIKSPAGLFTELTLPVSDIVAGEHYTDTINSATLSLQRINSTAQTSYGLSVPTNIVLLRKDNTYSFFEKNQLTNSSDSYLAEFDSDTGAYTFSNIGNLITLIKDERDAACGVTALDDEATRRTKYAAWEAEHPNWNKVVLVPVTAEYSTSTSSYGISTKTLVSLKNELGMYSVRLKGGSGTAIDLDVIYSKFKQ